MLRLDLPSRNASADFDLPSYSPPLPTSPFASSRSAQHTYHLAKSGKPWLTLFVNSHAARPDHTPAFSQSQSITGSVKVELANDTVIRAVSVSVFGELTSPTDMTRFLTITKQLFVSDMSELPTEPIPRSSMPVIHPGKLSGTHVWPFSIQLPKGVCIVLSDGVRNNFRLPPSFFDRDNKAHVQYYVVVRVKKGTLSSGQKLSTTFKYTPLTRPAEPSVNRQIAYLERSPLLGPDSDPDGWKALKAINIKGTIFNSRTIEASCQLFISRPLCYARGSVIHLAMKITTPQSDIQALDLLSSPSALDVKLVRNSKFSISISVNAIQVLGPWDSKPQEVCSATWWTPFGVGVLEEDNADSITRVLHGEIVVPEDLTPTCRILNFQLDYMVTLNPFKAVAFSPSGSVDGPLLTETVTIVTVNAQGPQPTPHSEALPTYVRAGRVP